MLRTPSPAKYTPISGDSDNDNNKQPPKYNDITPTLSPRTQRFLFHSSDAKSGAESISWTKLMTGVVALFCLLGLALHLFAQCCLHVSLLPLHEPLTADLHLTSSGRAFLEFPTGIPFEVEKFVFGKKRILAGMQVLVDDKVAVSAVGHSIIELNSGAIQASWMEPSASNVAIEVTPAFVQAFCSRDGDVFSVQAARFIWESCSTASNDANEFIQQAGNPVGLDLTPLQLTCRIDAVPETALMSSSLASASQTIEQLINAALSQFFSDGQDPAPSPEGNVSVVEIDIVPEEQSETFGGLFGEEGNRIRQIMQALSRE